MLRENLLFIILIKNWYGSSIKDFEDDKKAQNDKKDLYGDTSLTLRMKVTLDSHDIFLSFPPPSLCHSERLRESRKSFFSN
ncbi:MAG: hypothetical protein PHQ76_04645, partial [Caldisericia bacterium]|nr:hypothetical protein [Caldisericia bacterium]